MTKCYINSCYFTLLYLTLFCNGLEELSAKQVHMYTSSDLLGYIRIYVFSLCHLLSGLSLADADLAFLLSFNFTIIFCDIHGLLFLFQPVLSTTFLLSSCCLVDHSSSVDDVELM